MTAGEIKNAIHKYLPQVEEFEKTRAQYELPLSGCAGRRAGSLR